MRRGLCVALLVIGWSLPARAAISMSPNPLDVSNVMLGGSAMATGTLTSTESVRVDLRVTNSCSGTGTGTFELDKTTNVNLNAPQSITVTYTPATRGARQCAVTVTRNGSNDIVGAFYVRGTGLAPQSMSISGNTSFGSVRWNDAAPVHTSSRTFTVTNGGDVTLTISSVTVTGDFSITSAPTSPMIPPGNAKSWTITFDPSAPGGNKAGTLTFTGDAPGNTSESFNLTGIATNAVITVNDPSFGIVNTGSSASADVTVTNNAAAPKGPLGVTSASITGGGGWFSFAGCGGGTSCTFAPALSITSATVVGVRCSPPVAANANDMQTATVTFTSDTDNATPDNVATLTCVAGKSSLATSMSTVTFAPQLVATTSTPVMFTVTNTGNVDATFYLMRTGANAGAFTASTPTGCGTSAQNQCTVLANNGTATVTVAVTPGIEGDVTAGLSLVSTATPFPQLTLSARGIDRHIDLIESVQFPDTFRNPGDMATVMPVTIKNIGEYPLQVSQVALQGAPSWEIVEPEGSFEIGGLSSRDVMVAFTPVTAGKAPDATLAIASDDRNTPLRTVVISGNGKDRNVGFGPGAIDFGNTGAGVPVRLTTIKRQEGWLTVSNDDEFDFIIRDIQFDAPGIFRVEGFGGDGVQGMMLAAGTRHNLEIVFTPPDVGEYTSNMTLFLDQDPLGQRTVQLSGTALFVDARGGGGFGCSVGGATGGSAGAGVALVLFALVRRRRQHGGERARV